MRTLKLVLKVDVIGGIGLLQCCIELCEMAKRMGCMVEAEFNSYTLRALPDDKPETLAREYNRFSFG